MIIRNDDVSANSNFQSITDMYRTIKMFYPDVEIWSCITLLSKDSSDGAVYPGSPFKKNDLKFFFDVDQYLPTSIANRIPGSKIVSHGLWHFNHAVVTSHLQEASIVSSCRLLKTNVFVPPFNAWNKDTQDICESNGVRLVKFDEGWRSLEHNKFNPTHPLWYFHSWRYTLQEFERVLTNQEVMV